MGLKLASLEDLPVVQELINEFMQQYKFRDMFPNMDEIIPTYLDASTRTERVCILSDDNTGILALEKVPFLNIARIALVYIKEEHRSKGLMNEFLDAFEFWGKQIGCKYYNLGVSTGADPSSRGYEKYEVMYMKEVK